MSTKRADVVWGRGGVGGWGGRGLLALGDGVLAYEGGDGPGLCGVLGDGALQVLDRWVGTRLQQKLHDLRELAR